MKMRRDHSVPLPDQAITLLRELQPLTGEGAYLFPSLRSFQRPMTENTLTAALRRMEYFSGEMTLMALGLVSGLWLTRVASGLLT